MLRKILTKTRKRGGSVLRNIKTLRLAEKIKIKNGRKRQVSRMEKNENRSKFFKRYKCKRGEECRNVMYTLLKSKSLVLST